MLFILLSTVALVGAQTVYDHTYPFGNPSAPIDTVKVFDCGTNPNRAIKNPVVGFQSTDPNADPAHQVLTLPGDFLITNLQIEVAKPIVRPLNGKLEVWRTFWSFGRPNTIQLGCIGLPSSSDDVVGIDGFGTCDYGDLCEILDRNPQFDDITGQPSCFPEAIALGIPEDQCTCEGVIAPKVYTIDNWNKLIDFNNLDSGFLISLAAGDYELRATATNRAGEEEACIGITVPIEKAASGGWLFGRGRTRKAIKN